MKTLLSFLLAAAFTFSTPVRSEPLAHSPVIGTWAVDITRLPMPAKERPKSVTIHFAQAAGGRLATVVEVLDAGGGKHRAEGVAALDGTPAPVKGSFEADIAATTMPAPQVLVMQLGREGHPASTRVYVVAADGKTMVETSAFIGEDRRPVMRTHYFTRVR